MNIAIEMYLVVILATISVASAQQSGIIESNSKNYHFSKK
jgi:hypothetical protein